MVRSETTIATAIYMASNGLCRGWWCCRSCTRWTLPLNSLQPIGCNKNKNAFQWDAYHRLVDRIPACTARGGVCQGWGGGVFQGVSARGRGGMCIPPCNGADTPPPWTDRHLSKYNLRKFRLRAVKIAIVPSEQALKLVKVPFNLINKLYQS